MRKEKMFPGSGTGNKKCRILMLAACPFPLPQGSQILIHQLSLALAARGHDVHLLAYHLGDKETHVPYRISRIPLLPTYGRLKPGPSFQKPIVDGVLLASLLGILRREKVDIIHAHNYEAAIAAFIARSLYGIPVVYHGHTGMEDELPFYTKTGASKIIARFAGRVLDRQVPKRADLAIALSQSMTALLEKSGVDDRRIITVPPGIYYGDGYGETENWDEARKRKVEKKYGLAGGPKIVFTGNLSPYQNLPILARAFSLVREKHRDASLVILSHEKREMDSRAALGVDLPVNGGVNERGIFPIRDGGFSSVREVLGIGDVAVSLSGMMYGFPVKLLNYMAAGKAIVANKVSSSGIRHMIEGYTTGGSPEEVASGIETLLLDKALRDELGRNAKAKVEREHRWEPIAELIEERYARILIREGKSDLDNKRKNW